jgi:hypothetical protein
MTSKAPAALLEEQEVRLAPSPTSPSGEVGTASSHAENRLYWGLML